MPTTVQMLRGYANQLLEVMAELRGAFLEGVDTPEEKIEILAAQLTDPTSIQMVYEELAETHPLVEQAIETLLKESGEMSEAQFSREYGGVRRMGPARLERETPWFYPESVAELLYYYGLIGAGFRGAGPEAHATIYVPSDVIPWLPHPHSATLEDGLNVRPIAPPPASRTLLVDDSFLEDAGTLIGFLHTDHLRLTPAGPDPADIDRFVQRLHMPFSDEADLNARLALLLHLANRLGWLRRADDGVVQLTGNSVRSFLDKTRAEQRLTLWEAWRDSPEWNDLCRTPGIECANAGNWSNDPVQTRSAVLCILATLQPGAWYSQSEVIEALKAIEPDFQRPTGDYDTWYIRNTATQEFLKGFEQWDAVEGALLRFLLRGPLYWLQVMDLAEPSAGDDFSISLSQWGAYWLVKDSPQPHEAARPPISVEEDYTVVVPYGTPLIDRFRVERFAEWKSSYPHYVYQIRQQSLQRAAQEGIVAERIVEFLKQRTRAMPDKVAKALLKFGEAAQTVSSGATAAR